MQNKFLVGNGEREFAHREYIFVNALTEDEAIDKYICYWAVRDDDFIDFIYEKGDDPSFAEKFWLSVDDVALSPESVRRELESKVFTTRAHRFFGDYPEYARLYLDYFYDDVRSRKSDQQAAKRFPDKMLIYIWKKLEWSNIRAVSFDHIIEI